MRAYLTYLVLGASVCVGCADRKLPLNSGGSTFAYPMMSRWTGQYQKRTGVEIRYHSLGSGEGIRNMTNRKFDFGCTDAPMNSMELEAASAIGGKVLHIPLFLGAVVPAYSLEEVQEPLKFSGQVLAEIFLGKIRRWNDESLKHLNPGVQLPDKEIGVACRLDSSGTTYIFTEYLARVCPEFKDRIGFGKDVQWPVGVRGNGNEAVAGLVKRSPGAIGYIELSTAKVGKFQYGLVQNRDGKFVKASPESIAAAAESLVGKKIPDDLRFSFEDAGGADSYPISGATWAVAYADQKGAKGREVVDFLNWAMHSGQESLDGLGYAPLPPSLLEKARQRMAEFVTDR